MAPHARTSFLDNTKAGPSGDASVPLLSNTDQPSAPALEQQYASAPPDADAGGTSSPLQQDAKPEGTAYSLPSNYQPHYASEDMLELKGTMSRPSGRSHIMMFCLQVFHQAQQSLPSLPWESLPRSSRTRSSSQATLC